MSPLRAPERSRRPGRYVRLAADALLAVAVVATFATLVTMLVAFTGLG